MILAVMRSLPRFLISFLGYRIRLRSIQRSVMAVCVALSSSLAVAQDTLHIGSKRFTESYILAQVLAQTASPRATVEVLPGLGNTAIVYAALHSGSIDMYPEYLGTIALEILKDSQLTSIETIRDRLRPLGFGVGIPLGFNNGYALAMLESTARHLSITTLADLAEHPDLRLGLTNEFIGRGDGWSGLAKHYALRQNPVGLDHGLAYDAVVAAQVDVIDIYTTDAKIDHLGLRVLTDNASYFPRYDAVVLYRLDVPQRFPAAWAAMQNLAGTIDEKTMIGLNARAELLGDDFVVIAKHHLAGKPMMEPISSGFLSKLFGPDFLRLTLQHLSLVLTSVGLAVVIGVPAAVFVAPHPAMRAAVLGTCGVLQTVPSLAMLALLITWVDRIGSLPALIALTLYALLPIMRNTCTGLAEVPAGLSLAGMALGLTKQQRLRWIELPLSLPTIIAGIRTAISISVGTATIAAFIGAGGYGERIVTGLALNDKQLLLAGALPSAAMALLFEGLFEFAELVKRRRRSVQQN